jgi:hypothetical protein
VLAELGIRGREWIDLPDARNGENKHGESDDTHCPPQHLLADRPGKRIGCLRGLQARQSESRDEQGQQSETREPLPQRRGSGDNGLCAGDYQQRCSAEFQKCPAVQREVAFYRIKRCRAIVRIIGSYSRI